MPAPILPIALALLQFAPSLMRFFGAGETSVAVADKVVDIAKTVSGAPSGPEALEAIRQSAQLQRDFSLAALAQDGALEQAYLADRRDARDRDVKLHQAGYHNTRADLMVLFDVLGLIAGIGGMLALGYIKAKHPESVSEGVFGALVAQLATITSYFGLCLRDAHQFEFGSSRGSREKDALMAAESKK